MGTTFKKNLIFVILCSTLPCFVAASLESRQGNTACSGPFTLECCEALGNDTGEVAQALASIGVTSAPGGLVGFGCAPGICTSTVGLTSVCCSNVTLVAEFGISLGCAPLNR